MDNQTLVSVGIPTYNRPEGLRKTLECITKQTYKKLEIIVSDNCSPSTEVERIINEFKDKDSRIIFYRQKENFGPLNNFTVVLEKSTGEYFMWAADDDEWELEFIEKNLNLILSDSRYIASFSNFCVVDIHGNKILTYPDFLPYLKNISNFSKYKRMYNFISQHEKNGKANLFYSLIKSDILKKLFKDFSNFNTCASDDLFILRWLSKGNIAIVDNILYRSVIGYPKYLFTENPPKKKIINLLLLRIDINIINNTLNGWYKYLKAHFPIIRKCDLNSFEKIKLYNLVVIRIFLLLFDIVTFSLSTPYFNLFAFFRRENHLINISSSQE